jgi:hypothetical protein
MNSAYQPQQFAPQMYAMPAPASDPFENASRLIDIADRIAGRRGGQSTAAPEPGLSQQSPFNVAQFQPMPQGLLQQQELLLRNPSLLQGQGQISQQQMQQVQQIVGSYAQVAQQALGDQRKAMQLASIMHEAFMQMSSYAGNLERAVAMGQIMHSAFMEMSNYADQLSRTVAVLSTAPVAMQAYQNELDAAYRLIDVANHMLQNPIYLLEHSFGIFGQQIDENDAPFISVLSRLYLALIEKHENMLRQKTGQYSPKYQQYLQSNVNMPQQSLPPFPQAPQELQNVPGDLSPQAVNILRSMNQPGFGKALQRQHVMQKQRGF